MTTHIALLRGVNVGGNTLKMERLRKLCEELGFRNARTFLQSGNVIFETDDAARTAAADLESRLAEETRLPVTVILRSARQWQTLAGPNPFLKRTGIDHAKLHVTFLSNAATKTALTKLASIDADADEFYSLGTEIYMYCPNGYGRTKLSNNVIERTLSLKATTRNWNTVVRLHEMAACGFADQPPS